MLKLLLSLMLAALLLGTASAREMGAAMIAYDEGSAPRLVTANQSAGSVTLLERGTGKRLNEVQLGGDLRQLARRPFVAEPGARFAYDNESPRHRVLVPAHALADRPLSNAEYRAFIDDGGSLGISFGYLEDDYGIPPRADIDEVNANDPASNGSAISAVSPRTGLTTRSATDTITAVAAPLMSGVKTCAGNCAMPIIPCVTTWPMRAVFLGVYQPIGRLAIWRPRRWRPLCRTATPTRMPACSTTRLAIHDSSTPSSSTHSQPMAARQSPCNQCVSNGCSAAIVRPHSTP